jgi:hypothetical protein
MTDKEILDELYNRMANIVKNGDANVPSRLRLKEFKEFIERKRTKRTTTQLVGKSEWAKRKIGDLWHQYGRRQQQKKG